MGCRCLGQAEVHAAGSVVGWNHPAALSDWQPFSAAEMRRIRDYVIEQRTDDRPFEIISGGLSGAGPQAVRPFIEAGATWWVEGDMGTLSFDALRERLRRGPPV